MISFTCALFIFLALAFDGVPVLSSLDAVLGVAIIFFYLTCVVYNRKLDFRLVLLIPFSIFLIFSARNEFSHLLNVISIIIIWIASYITVSFLIERGKERYILYSFLFALFLNILAVLIGFDSYWEYGGVKGVIEFETAFKRPSALLGNPNVFGLLAIGTLLVFTNIRNFNTSVFFLLSIAVIYVSIITASRKTAIMIPVIFLSYFSFVKPNVSFKVKYFIYLFFLSAFSLAVYILFYHLEDILVVERIVNVKSDTSANSRAVLIEEAVESIMVNPFFGYGLGWFSANSSYKMYSHVNFLELWLSGGVLLFISYYVIHFFIAVKSLLMKTYFRLISIFFIFILDFAMVSYDLNIVAILVCFLLVKAFPFKTAMCKETKSL